MHFRVPTGHILATSKTNVPAITKNKDGRSPKKDAQNNLQISISVKRSSIISQW